MQIFFVSVRTGLIYGPGDLLEARASESNRMTLRLSWPNAYGFDEWEGYAVVAPERDEVWGLSHPGVPESGELSVEFAFTPQAIPPQERKLFAAPEPARPAPKAQADEEETWSFYQEEASSPYDQQDSFQRDSEG